MNSTIPENAYLLVFVEGKLVVVREASGAKWNLPKARVMCVLDRPHAQMVLARHYSRVTVVDSAEIPKKEWEQESYYFPEAKLYACVIEPAPSPSNPTHVWSIGKDSPSHILSEEVIAVLSLPYVQSRLS